MSQQDSTPAAVSIGWACKNCKATEIQEKLNKIFKRLGMGTAKNALPLQDSAVSCTIVFDTKKKAMSFVKKAKENKQDLDKILKGFKTQDEEYVGSCHNQNETKKEESEDDDVPPHKVNDFIEVCENGDNGENEYTICQITDRKFDKKDNDWEFDVKYNDGETRSVREKEATIEGINVAVCPTPDCHGWMNKARADKNGCSKCGKCGFTSCIKCNARPFHNNQDCNEYKIQEKVYEKKLNENESQLFFQLAKKNGWKKCPQCGMIQERPFGCFHLICVIKKCQAHYCDECGEALESGKWKDHFKEGSKCKLWKMEENDKIKIVQGYSERKATTLVASGLTNGDKQDGNVNNVNNETNKDKKEEQHDPDYEIDFEVSPVPPASQKEHSSTFYDQPLGEVQDPVKKEDYSDNTCEICRAPLTWNEVIELTGQSHTNERLCHAGCKSKKQRSKPGNRLWYAEFVGHTSQFKEESTGSCTINGLEAAIQLQLGIKPSVELVDKIVAIASVYKADKHTGIEDIFPSISRYNNSLKQVDYVQLLKSAGHVLFESMKSAMDKYGHAISCVVTAPPESFFLHLDFDGSVTMFDSHPRGHLGLKNSHFLLFENSNKCLEYLKQELLKCVKLDVSDISAYQLQAMNAFEANLLMLNSNVKVNDRPDIEQLKRELMRVDDRLNKQFAFENKKHGNDYSDLLRHSGNGNGNGNGKYQQNNNHNHNRNRNRNHNHSDNNNKSYNNNYDNNYNKNQDWYENRIQELEAQLESMKMILNSNGDSEMASKTIAQYASKVQRLEDRNAALVRQCEQMRDDMNSLTKTMNANSNKDDEKYNFSSKLQNQFYCYLCNKYKKGYERVSLSNCKCDNLCCDCLIQYVTTKINEKEIQIQCPKCHNNKNITDDDIGKLSSTLGKLYQGLINEHYNKEAQQNLRRLDCRNNKCKYNGFPDSWIECKRTYLICPQCQSCAICKDCTLIEPFHKNWADCKTALLRANNPPRFMICGCCADLIENKTATEKVYKPLRQCGNCNKNVCFKCGLTQSDKIHSSVHFSNVNPYQCNGQRFKKKV